MICICLKNNRFYDITKTSMKNKQVIEEVSENYTNEEIQPVSVDSSLEKKQEELKNNSIVIKISSETEGKDLNKFDLFWIKVWSFICSFIETVSRGINKVIKLIFRKQAPLKYIKAFVSTILVIISIAIIAAPFNITVNKIETLEIFSSNLVAVEKEIPYINGNPEYKWGYANKKGEIKIDCEYDAALEFKHGVAFVNKTVEVDGNKKNYWMLINTKGKQVGSQIIETSNNPNVVWVENFADDVKLAKVCVSGKYGYLNNKGKLKIEAVYDNAGNFCNGLAMVSIGSQYYYINSKGKKVTEEFTEARDFCNEMAAVKRNDRWGFIDTKGNIVIEIRYDSVSDFNGNYAVVKSGTSYGVIDKKGAKVVPTGLYTDIGIIKDNFPEYFA